MAISSTRCVVEFLLTAESNFDWIDLAPAGCPFFFAFLSLALNKPPSLSTLETSFFHRFTRFISRDAKSREGHPQILLAQPRCVPAATSAGKAAYVRSFV
jgi:hypothetical protein